MVSLTNADFQENYGIDLPTLRRTCPDALIGVVTREGVIWRGARGSPCWPAEDRLVDIVRSRDVDECLFLHTDGGTREALESRILSRGTEMRPYWVHVRRGACCLLCPVATREPAS